MKKINFKNFGGGLKKYRFLSEIFFVSATLSLIGVGFGSFQIGNNDTNFKISTGVGNLVTFNDYISDLKIDTFDICEYGLVIDETLTYEGNIKISFSILIKDKLEFTDYILNNTLSLYINLTNKGNFNFFHTNYFSGHNNKPSIKFGYSLSTSNFVLNNLIESELSNEGYIKTKFIITDNDLKNANKVFVSFEYPFDFSNYKNTSNNENNFKNNIYSKLSNTNNLAFDISIGAN